MTFWQSVKATLARNPISMFAVLCVASTAALLGVLTFRLLKVLESPAWCAKAIQAERVSAENFGGLTACTELLTIQLNAVSTGFHISTGGFVFVLVVLIVVVVAGARASGKLPGGIQFDVSRSDEAAAAQHVADEAQVAADEVKGAPAKAVDAGLPDSIR